MRPTVRPTVRPAGRTTATTTLVEGGASKLVGKSRRGGGCGLHMGQRSATDGRESRDGLASSRTRGVVLYMRSCARLLAGTDREPGD